MSSSNEDGKPVGPAHFIGREPIDLKPFLAPVLHGKSYIDGTAVRAIAPRFVQRADGLFVPDHLAAGPAPIDQMIVYMTAEEVFGISVSVKYIRDGLRLLSAGSVIGFVASVMAKLRSPGVRRAEADEYFAKMWFKGDAQVRALNILKDRTRGLIVPQALMSLAQKSMAISGDCVLPGNGEGNIIAILMGVADHLVEEWEHAGDLVVSDAPGELGRELISNQVFNAEVDDGHLVTRFVRTWLELSKTHADGKVVFDLESTYEDVTGVPLRDVLAAGLALRAATMNGKHVFNLSYLVGLGWEIDRIVRAMRHYLIDIPNLRYLSRLEMAQETATSWSFETFQHFPVVVDHDGNMAVIDPSLLMKRIFGWRPLFDLKGRLQSTGRLEDRTRASHIDNCLRRLAEIYAIEIIDSMTGHAQGSQRVYHEDDLKVAYPDQGVKNADAAIDYGDSWVIVEITTIQLRRHSVAGVSDDSVMADLNKLVAKAMQLESTINELRRNEKPLTGQEGSIRKRYFPLLVLTEGFPVNPISLTLLRNKIKERGILTSVDVMPLEIADLRELEMIEALQEQGGPSLRDVLDAKRGANLRIAQLRDYILVEMKKNLRHGSRVREKFHRSFAELISHIDPNFSADKLSDGEMIE